MVVSILQTKCQILLKAAVIHCGKGSEEKEEISKHDQNKKRRKTCDTDLE